jgi:cyanophycinase
MWKWLPILLLSRAALAQTAYDYFPAGDAADVKTAVSAGFALLGGSKDVDGAFEWLNRKSGGGDFVVIRASGGDSYNKYIAGLGEANSVESLVIKTAEAAGDPFVSDRIRKAEALFIAGGNQWNYLRVWGASPMKEAMQSLIDRGVPIGGTSAGLAVLGEFVFTAERGSVTSAQALADPYDPRVTVGTDFLRIPLLENVITDTHFVKRDRLGRLLTFMARILEDGRAREARAIAVDERTAALVEGDGSVSIEGEGPVYFLRAAIKPEVCKTGTPLTFRGIEAYKATKGARFDLRKWSGSGGTAYRLSVEGGVAGSTQTGGLLY